MKKIFTLLLLTLAAFGFSTSAQTTVCNAEFSVQYITNTTVKFNPVIAAGLPTYQHIWNFGDGSPVNNNVSPTHIYAAVGTYTTVHTIIRYNPNNIPECTQSFTRTVIVTAVCNLVVDFSWTNTTASPLTIAFHNLSVPLATTDSITWHFGDGTSSNAVNPVHTYANAGTYTVCLRVKKNANAGSTTPCVREICKTIVVTSPCNLQAYFSSQTDSLNPLKVHFSNLSTPVHASDSVRWTFGDGTSLSGLQGDPNIANPTHVYANAGAYNVCIRVKKNNSTTANTCVREFCKIVTVTQPCNLTVNFNWTATAGNPLRIEFHNLSTPIAVTDSIRWTFGDGSSSSAINPVHTYNVAGTYTVCLRIIRYNTGSTTPCIREICKTVVIQQPCSLIVNFSSQADPNHLLRIKFTNLSTPLNVTDSVRWTFGDGTSVSGLQGDPNVANPTHNYTSAGSYTVCLRVKKNNNTGSSICVREKCETIVVTQPCNFQAAFTWRLDSANHRKVYFTNQTNAPTAASSATWSFGDGTTANSWNAIHEYAQPGIYRVCLRIVAAPNCVREICDTVIIPNPPPSCTQLSKFRFEKSSNDNQQYKFTPEYLNTTLQYTWTFGDGTGSHDPIATHRYAQPGVYTACLTVWRGPNCASTTCKEVVVRPQINCDTAHVNYTYQRNPQVPNKIQFYAHSTLPLLDQTWTITRLNGTVATTPVILHQNNPVYLFQDTGLYKVCLRAITIGGCVKEYCEYIRIQQVVNACVLQVYPNPASTTVNVNVYLTQPEMIHAYVYNSLNVLVLDKHQQGYTGNNLVTLNINQLAAGQYNIKLVYGNRVCYGRFQKL